LALVLWSGFVPEVSLLALFELSPVLPLIEPALEVCCESVCLSMESEEPVCGVVAEGACVSCVVVDDVLC
jgi:hypothetical protein